MISDVLIDFIEFLFQFLYLCLVNFINIMVPHKTFHRNFRIQRVKLAGTLNVDSTSPITTSCRAFECVSIDNIEDSHPTFNETVVNHIASISRLYFFWKCRNFIVHHAIPVCDFRKFLFVSVSRYSPL